MFTFTREGEKLLRVGTDKAGMKRCSSVFCTMGRCKAVSRAVLQRFAVPFCTFSRHFD